MSDGSHRGDERSSTVAAMRSVIEANATGDLTRRMDEDLADEELAVLARAYNEMLDDWADRFESVDEFGSQIVSATEGVTERVDSAQAASREVSRGIEEIADGATEQDEYIQEISDEMRTLSATIEEIAASADEVVTAATHAAAEGDRGQDAAEAVIDDLEALETVTGRTVENVERLNDLMDEIRDVAAFIDDVAEQTNILALNANIEAARAGEAGTGFAVVADEVKELAEETQDATDEIEDSIRTVREGAEDAVDDIHETRERVHASVETVDDALTALEDIVAAVDEVQQGLEEISEATDEQASSTQEVVDMVDEVGSISEETADEAEVVATSAQQGTTALTEIRTSITTLSERADDLQSLLSELDTAGGGTVGSVEGTATTVEFWHAMSGDKALLLDDLARDFEDQSDHDVTISLEGKGSYRGTLNAAVDAVRAGEPPAITQIFEIGTKRAMDSGGFVPIERYLSADVLDVDALLDPVVNYYRTDGRLYSLPFNSSNPICCYNADAFAAAGLDPTEPPETFEAVREAAERLVAEGVTEYGVTFANYSWFVEQWFAEQGQELVDRRNGHGGTAERAFLDGDAAHRIFEWWAGMDRDGCYYNPGVEARGEAKDAFHDERAAILIGSTSSLSGIEAGASDAGFEMRTGYFPVPADVDRHGVLVGGASLWLADEVPREKQEAAAEFVGWLANPEQQARWHRETGYFPIHEGAVETLDAEGWFDENPHFATAFDQLRETKDTVATRGARIGPFDTVRTMIEESYEGMSDGEPVDDALTRLTEKVERQLRAYRDGGS